jgi:hypothetical protein
MPSTAFTSGAAEFRFALAFGFAFTLAKVNKKVPKTAIISK